MTKFYASTVKVSSNPLSGWRRVQEGQLSVEQVLHLLVDSHGELHQEFLDEEVCYRFFHTFDDRNDLPPLIPLLLWRGVFYLGCPRALTDHELQFISSHTHTGVEVIFVSSQSYLNWYLRQNLPAEGQIEAEPIVNPLTGETDPSHLEEITELYLSQAIDQTNRIDAIISIALQHRGTDIHFEPIEQGLRVRCRIDGMMRLIKIFPVDISRKVIVAIKVMANLNIAETRSPQDGRISRLYKGSDGSVSNLDIRVSTYPCMGGEKVAMRLLHRRKVTSLEELGLENLVQERFQALLQEPQGMIIITGPTGSGKTTTLYAGLQYITSDATNIITLEDPVEYTFPLITQGQVQVNGMDFASGLRAILRQDPDVIVVGEIRDAETAVVAIRASLTGHLVLSTMHTNNAIGAIFRLKDFGISNNLIGEGLLAILGQRLVRKICSKCKEPYSPSSAELSFLNLSPDTAASFLWQRGKGCEKCFYSGYLGQESLVEILPIDSKIFELPTTDLRKEMQSRQEFTFLRAAREKVLSGKTTVSEVKRVLASNILGQL